MPCLHVRGCPSFKVWKALLSDGAHSDVPEYIVAAKIAIENGSSTAATDDLLNEATVMAQVGEHRNLVSLIGVVTRRPPYVLVVYEHFGRAFSSFACPHLHIKAVSSYGVFNHRT